MIEYIIDYLTALVNGSDSHFRSGYEYPQYLRQYYQDNDKWWEDPDTKLLISSTFRDTNGILT